MSLLKKWTFENKIYFVLLHVIILLFIFNAYQNNKENNRRFNLLCAEIARELQQTEGLVEQLIPQEDESVQKNILATLTRRMGNTNELLETCQAYISDSIRYSKYSTDSFISISDELNNFVWDDDLEDGWTDYLEAFKSALHNINSYLWIETEYGGYITRDDLTPTILNNLLKDFFSDLFEVRNPLLD